MANSKDSSLRKLICGFEHENEAYESGAKIIAGLDEVGKGALFSVVTAGAVILPRDCKLEGLRDSKLISPKKRQRLAVEIKEQAIAWSIAHVPAAEIDRTNIAAATEMAMYEAIHGLDVMPDLLLIDAVAVDIPILQISIIHGDAVSGSCSYAAFPILNRTGSDIKGLRHLLLGKPQSFPSKGQIDLIVRLLPRMGNDISQSQDLLQMLEIERPVCFIDALLPYHLSPAKGQTRRVVRHIKQEKFNFWTLETLQKRDMVFPRFGMLQIDDRHLAFRHIFGMAGLGDGAYRSFEMRKEMFRFSQYAGVSPNS